MTTEHQLDMDKMAQGAKDKYEVVEWQTVIKLDRVVYTRRDVGLGSTGNILIDSFGLGQKAVFCEHMPIELQEQIEEYVHRAEGVEIE